MLAGRTLQKAYNQKPQDVITYELMDGTDGRKMSTSWGNVILIEDEPNDIYGKIMSMRDEGVLKYFELATDMEMQEIQKIKKDLKANKLNPRDLKMRLAREIITMYHSEKDALNAEENFKKVFQDKGVPKDIKEEKIDKKWLKLKLKNDKKELVEREEYSVNILDLLVKTKLCSSKSEARRVVEQGGVKFNKKIIKNVTENVSVDKGWKILQKGKRHFVKIKL